MDSAPEARCQFGTWRAGRASQAGRPGRGGCERARPLRARSASRASQGRLRREAPGEPAASVLPPAELCAAAAAAAAPSPTCWRRRDKEGEEEGGGGAGGGGASPLLPPAPTSRGLRSPQLSACKRPAPGQARPQVHAAGRGCFRSPGSPACLPAWPLPPGAASEFEASVGRPALPQRAWDTPGHPSPAEQPPAHSGQPERASKEAPRAPEGGPVREEERV